MHKKIVKNNQFTGKSKLKRGCTIILNPDTMLVDNLSLCEEEICPKKC